MAGSGEWKKSWDKAKKTFESNSGKKKPAESYLKLFRKSSGVSSAMDTMDKAYKQALQKKGNERMAALGTFEKAVRAAETKADTYIGELVKEMDKNTNAAKDADAKARAKALNGYLEVLAEDLEALIDSADAELKMQRALTDEEGNVDIRMARSKAVFMANMPKVCKSGMRWVLRQEKSPDPASFNAGVQKVCRDITQNSVNLQNLEPKGSQTYKQLEKLNTLLVAYGNNGKKVEADRADKAIVALGQLKNNIVAMNRWYMKNK